MIHFVPIIGELRKDATAAATACSKVLSLSLPPIIQSSSGLYYNLAASSDCFIGSSTRRSNPEAKQSWNIVEEIRVSQVSDKLKQLFWMKILIFKAKVLIKVLKWTNEVFQNCIGLDALSAPTARPPAALDHLAEFVLFQFSCQKYFNIRASLAKQRRQNSILLLKNANSLLLDASRNCITKEEKPFLKLFGSQVVAIFSRLARPLSFANYSQNIMDDGFHFLARSNCCPVIIS